MYGGFIVLMIAVALQMALTMNEDEPPDKPTTNEQDRQSSDGVGTSGGPE